MFSESALKNVKTMKQRCSALIISGTSIRVSIEITIDWFEKDVVEHVLSSEGSNSSENFLNDLKFDIPDL